jgi:hypothetical protein
MVMKLLLESWRRFLKEDSTFFGESFVEFKRRLSVGQHPLSIARDILTEVGKGSTRIVFGFPDNDSHLLKIINVEVIGDEEFYDQDAVNPKTGFNRRHKTVSNENEADLKMQQKYPNVFPRTYEVGDDFSWILAERVQPIRAAQLSDIFKLPVAVMNNKQDYLGVMMIARNYMDSNNDVYSLNEDFDWDADTEVLPPLSSREPTPSPDSLDAVYSFMDLARMAQKILSNPHHRTVFKAAAQLKIPPRELTAKNFGISKFGGDHLVILDASLWEYEE